MTQPGETTSQPGTAVSPTPAPPTTEVPPTSTVGDGAGAPVVTAAAPTPTSTIAGLSVLKGLVLYGATLTFAAFYTYFIWEIATATGGTPPTFNGAIVSAGAALAGVLGSAFALFIGVPTDTVNENLQASIAAEGTAPKARTRLRRILSLEPARTGEASWPLTFGIWVYAIIASAVAIAYFLNQDETPDPIKALAVAFAGYVLALITAAYGLASKK